MPARARQLGVVAPSGRPLKKTSPAEGRIWPPSKLSTVDLPAPLGPMKTWMSCSRISRSTESTALNGPYDFESPRVDRRTAPSAVTSGLSRHYGPGGGWRSRAQELRRVLTHHRAHLPFVEPVVEQVAD